MTDDKFEEFLQREARAYNAPPSSVPRDEMWRAISVARGARPGGIAPGAGAGDAAGASTADITPIDARKPRLRYAPWIGMAATLLVGIGIGRFAMERGGTLPTTTMVQAPAAPTTGQPDAAVATPGDPDVASAANAASAGTPGAANTASADTPDDTPRRESVRPQSPTAVTRLASNAGRASRNGAAAAPVDDATDAFQVASRDHLVRAEALVSVVAATPADAVMDSLTGRWAREMLTNTRLLLDSPAGDDPVRRRLLEDLETVLVQLVQRSGAAVDERALIDRTLERTQLLTRLRTSAAGI